LRNIEVLFVYQINLELSSQQSKPGEQVSIKVSTKPNSYVGLLGVDQSVLLLKKGNDIEKSAVFEQLDKYNEKTRWNRRWYSGNSGSYSDFENSGAAIITNAKEEIRESFQSFPLFLFPQLRSKSKCFDAISLPIRPLPPRGVLFDGSWRCR
jgi:Alpha-2-macroglobulin bait region domain